MKLAPPQAPFPKSLKAQEPPRLSKWGLDEGDLSLIHWMLEMTPAERLRYAEGFASSVEVLRNARRT